MDDDSLDTVSVAGHTTDRERWDDEPMDHGVATGMDPTTDGGSPVVRQATSVWNPWVGPMSAQKSVHT